MDKTSGFALIGFLCIALGFGFSRAMAGGGGGGAMMVGGGGGGGGGDPCSIAIARMRQCQGEMLSEIPERYRDEAAAQFERKMSEAYGECLEEMQEHPELAQRVQACMQLTDCQAFARCL